FQVLRGALRGKHLVPDTRGGLYVPATGDRAALRDRSCGYGPPASRCVGAALRIWRRARLMALVEIREVRKRFGALEVLKGITLDVEPGEVVCLLGPSGSGKTTLLRCVTHLEKIDAGEARVEGESMGYKKGPGGELVEESDR